MNIGKNIAEMTQGKIEQDVLIIGCGTSALSESIAFAGTQAAAAAEVEINEPPLVISSHIKRYIHEEEEEEEDYGEEEEEEEEMRSRSGQDDFTDVPASTYAQMRAPLPSPCHTFLARTVVSCDNDAAMISHMQTQILHKQQAQSQAHTETDTRTEMAYSKLQWGVHDVETDEGALAAIPTASTSTTTSTMIPKSYDLIVDKGTFDAILTEGSVASTLANIYRCVEPAATPNQLF